MLLRVRLSRIVYAKCCVTMNKLTKYILLVVVCVIIPSALVWNFLPSMLGDYPKVYSIVHRVTAIYITVVVTWLLISFANTFRSLGEHHNVPHQQYLNSFISVLKIVLIFIAVIVVIAIIVNKDPSTLIAGLGAASAILMLAFQDTIKGLVAGIRLTSNNMLAIGDRKGAQLRQYHHHHLTPDTRRRLVPELEGHEGESRSQGCAQGLLRLPQHRGWRGWRG